MVVNLLIQQDPNYWNKTVIIKGEIVVPRVIETVEMSMSHKLITHIRYTNGSHVVTETMLMEIVTQTLKN